MHDQEREEATNALISEQQAMIRELQEKVEACQQCNFERPSIQSDSARGHRVKIGQPATVRELQSMLSAFPDGKLMFRNGPLPTLYRRVYSGDEYIEYDWTEIDSDDEDAESNDDLDP